MINEEILGGLKAALARGESLEKAMMTFYNAGYDKTQIEESARSLQMYERQPTKVQQPKQTQFVSPVIPKKREPTRKEIREKRKQERLAQKRMKKPVLKEIQPKPTPVQSRPPRQSISQYGDQNPRDKLLVIILVFMLLFLLSILATIFFFKDELISLFNNLFQNGLSLFSR